MKKIDLSKIKHKVLPTKDVEIEIDGEVQTVTIRPINGRGLTSLGLISEDDLDKNAKMCLIALTYGLEIKQDEAELFMNNETIAADFLAAKILKYTQDYQASLNEATSEIKKNTRTKTTK